MLRQPRFAWILGSIYLVIYCLLMMSENLQWLAVILFFFSPFLVIWIALTIIRFGRYKGPDLECDEFGYQDRPKDALGIF
jgi:hypothetical protein